MDIDEALLLEILMDRVGDQGADAEYGLEGISTGTKMGDRPQVLERVALFLQRVIRAGRAFHRNLRSLDFKRLLGLRRSHQGSFYKDRRAYV